MVKSDCLINKMDRNVFILYKTKISKRFASDTCRRRKRKEHYVKQINLLAFSIFHESKTHN